MSDPKQFDVIRQGITPALFPDEVFAYFSIPEFDEFGKPGLTAGGEIESNKFVVREGDVLLSKLNPRIKRVWEVEGYGNRRAVASTEFVCLRPTDKTSSEYLFFALQDDRVFALLRAYATGTTNSHQRFQPDEIHRAPVPYFPPTTQQKIARILQTVDRAMEKTEALIEKYQQIKAGLMHDLFTRGLWTQEELDRGDHLRAAEQSGLPAIASVTAGQLRPTRQDAPHLYQETPIGWIPKAWTLSICSEICEAVIDCKNRTPPITPEGYPVIRTPNVRDGRFVEHDLVYTDFHSYVVWTYRGMPRPGDIVITREAPVGEVCKIPERHPKSCLGQRMMLYRTDPTKIVNDFFLFVLQSNQIQTRLDLISGGSTVGHVRVGDIRNLWVFLPESKVEQKRMAEILGYISLKLEAEEECLFKLQKQKAGLMHDLLTGKVPVTPDPEEASNVS